LKEERDEVVWDSSASEQILNEDDQLMVFTCGRRTFMPHQLAFKLMRRVRFKQQLDINRSVWDVARFVSTQLPNFLVFHALERPFMHLTVCC
jgi:hypothetical protein